MPHLRICLFCLGSLVATAQSTREYFFDDGTGIKTWSVENTTAASYFQIKEQEIILHPKGTLPDAKNRRVLTPRIHLVMYGSLPPGVIAKALGASSFKVPHYSKKISSSLTPSQATLSTAFPSHKPFPASFPPDHSWPDAASRNSSPTIPALLGATRTPTTSGTSTTPAKIPASPALMST